MDIETFWKLVDETRLASSGDRRMHEDLLINRLAQFPEGEIIAWGDVFDDLMDEAYIAELWDVAFLVGCGCSDDGFEYFRAWLIGQGHDVYRKVIADPEVLVELVKEGQEAETQDSSLWYVEIGAYALKTGRDNDDEEWIKKMPGRRKPTPKLRGVSSPSEAAILARFPRAAARFWKRCREQAGLA